MADQHTALARRLRPTYRVVSHTDRSKPHSGRNTVNIAFPFSRITAAVPAKMTAEDWISLAALVTSVVGFTVVIRQLNRIADASRADLASDREDRGKVVVDPEPANRG